MQNQSTPGESLQNIVTESELLKLTGLTKAQLAALRNQKQLPFLRVTKFCRLYLESDIVEWLKAQRTVLNSD